MRAVSAGSSRSPRKFESMSRRCVMPAIISGLRMEVNWYYTGSNMQPAAHPSSTLMFAEASEAGQIVAKQLSENAVLAKELAKLLMRPATHTIFTCARGSSDHAAAYGKFLFETRLRKTVSSQIGRESCRERVCQYV